MGLTLKKRVFMSRIVLFDPTLTPHVNSNNFQAEENFFNVSPLYQSEIFILCWIKKRYGGNSLPTKMGGDFSKLCVALILAFIHIHQPETCRDLSKWGDLKEQQQPS